MYLHCVVCMLCVYVLSHAKLPMDWSSPVSSVHRIFQARILEWAAMLSSIGSSQPWDQTCIPCASCIGRQILFFFFPLLEVLLVLGKGKQAAPCLVQTVLQALSVSRCHWWAGSHAPGRPGRPWAWAGSWGGPCRLKARGRSPGSWGPGPGESEAGPAGCSPQRRSGRPWWRPGHPCSGTAGSRKAGRFFTTALPGKSVCMLYFIIKKMTYRIELKYITWKLKNGKLNSWFY